MAKWSIDPAGPPLIEEGTRPKLREAYLTKTISYSALLHVLRKTPACTEEMWAEMLERRTVAETQDLVVEFWRLYEEALLARRGARATAGEREPSWRHAPQAVEGVEEAERD